MIKKIRKTVRDCSIRTKLLLVFLFSTSIMWIATLYTYGDIDRKMDVIQQVYLGNIQLIDVTGTLEDIQSHMEEYLDTKSTASLNLYYTKEQEFETFLEELNQNITDDQEKIMEKNIRGISKAYLTYADNAVEAKRGRMVSTYNKNYRKACKLYQYLKVYLSSLNNEKFGKNLENYTSLASSLEILERSIFWVHFLVAFLNILLIVTLTRQITKPLTVLSEGAHQVAEGNFHLQKLETPYKDEVGIVTEAFNQMVISLNEYMDRARKSMEAENEARERELRMESNLKEAQLKYYQAQIHPHFLFNTLNAGAQLAMIEDAQQTETFLQKMAEFCRYSIQTGGGRVCLEDEIRMVESYLYIMNVRFAGDIHFEKEIKGEISQVMVPGMILQPIVENAVQHGIRDIQWEGKICLFVREEKDDYRILIEDNGVGITQERIQDILSGKGKKEEEDPGGIGLGNVMERLRLYYRQDGILSLESDGKNLGTRVTICIPKEGES